MAARFKFALVAAIFGAALGSLIGAIVQKKDDPFPLFLVIAFISIFAVCGVFSKRKWIDRVLDFFAHVVPLP
jgi:hypothetical protein